MRQYKLALPLLLLVAASACEFMPDKDPNGCYLLGKAILCPAGAGGGGTGGTGVAGTAAGTGGAGTGAAGTLSGTGGTAGTASGAGGSGGVGGTGGGGTGGSHMHGGLPVTPPLPASQPGSKTFDVRFTGEMPMPDAGGIGAARTRCHVSHVNFDDSLLYHGQPGMAHAHQYAGADQSDASGVCAGSAQCGGTCRGGAANLSSYWWPALLSPDGRVLTPDHSDHYYKASHYDGDKSNGTFSATVQPPPKGLKIIAGDMHARGPTQDLFRINWTCEGASGNHAAIPSGCSSPTMNVAFPQCWNGTSLDSADHKSHMSYPVNGTCPSTHPRLIPSISYHVRFSNVPAGSRLACDAATGPGGFCLHADLVVNWDEEIMATMVARCVNTGLSCGSHMVGDGRIME